MSTPPECSIDNGLLSLNTLLLWGQDRSEAMALWQWSPGTGHRSTSHIDRRAKGAPRTVTQEGRNIGEIPLGEVP